MLVQYRHRDYALHETSIQTDQTLNQKLETLEQQMDEISVFLAQSDIRRKKMLAQALAKLQSINTAVHFESTTIPFPNDADTEPMTPPRKDIVVDPMFLDTTTKGMADTLPIYHTAEYGLLERNPCSSDSNNELITLPSTSSMKGERVPSTPNFCSAVNLGTKRLYSNAVLEAKIAPTPSLLQNHLSTTCDSHFPGTKSPLSISKLLPDLLKESTEPRSAKQHGLQDFPLADPPIFLMWLPGGSAKTRPPGHRRGRPPRTACENLWQKALLSFYDGRHRGRPPRSAASHQCVLPKPDQTVNKKCRTTSCFPLNSGFSAGKKFNREHLLTFCKLDFYCRGKELFDENHVRFGA